LTKEKCGKCKHYYIKSGLKPVVIENLPDEIKEKFDLFLDDSITGQDNLLNLN
jgi:hypothetical protein